MKNTIPALTLGVDLGDRKHAVCVLGQDAIILKEFSVPNTADAIERLAADYPRARVAMEVGTHSPWVSRRLTAGGMEVFVANPRKLRAISANERKCDQSDARMLARLARVDPALLHPVVHGSEAAQRDLLSIKLRDTLVRQRVQLVCTIRASLKALGLRLASPSGGAFTAKARPVLAETPGLLVAVEPCLRVIDELSARIGELDRAIATAIQTRHPQAQKLQQITGVGPITSLSYVLTIEDARRFERARDVGAYLGLVPRRDQSGAVDKQLAISKSGNRHLRSLLVQSAHYILGAFGPDCDLRRQGLKLAARGGKAAKKRAIIAIARKLAVLMLALWKSQADYQPLRAAPASAGEKEPLPA